MDETEPQSEPDGGAPAWVMTFADLMSLLLTFFVLLLSFSEMDILRFKRLAGTMQSAFGAQQEVRADHVPKGTSVVAQEYSPGKPSPTIINEMRQQTTDETKDNLKFTDKDGDIKAELERQAEVIRQFLREEIADGQLDVDATDTEILIKIRERGSFTSGNARLQTSFLPALEKVSKVLNSIKGEILVAGHTDDVPINTRQYPSNWLLSSDRAANVVYFLAQQGAVRSDRMQIRAHADTRPVAPNDSPENRARNRRVEIIIKTNTSEASADSSDGDQQ